MTFWQRAPREVYHVYGEEEYLAEGEVHAVGEVPAEGDLHAGREVHLESDAHANAQRLWPSIEKKAQGSGSRRLTGLSLLVVVTVGALGLVFLNASHRSPAGPRSDISQGAEARAARPRSAGALAEPKSAVRASPGAISNPHASVSLPIRASVLRPVRLQLPTGSPIDPPPRPASMEIEQIRSSTAEPDAAAASSADDEFDFER